MRELGEEGFLREHSSGKRHFVLFSTQGKDLESEEWCEVESMKYCLRAEIERFEGMARGEQEKMGTLMAGAREQLALGNKITAKAMLAERVGREKKSVNIVTRKNVLEGQLTQLEYNEMNKSTLSLLEEAHSIYQQTAVDPSRLDDAMYPIPNSASATPRPSRPPEKSTRRWRCWPSRGKRQRGRSTQC